MAAREGDVQRFAGGDDVHDFIRVANIIIVGGRAKCERNDTAEADIDVECEMERPGDSRERDALERVSDGRELDQGTLNRAGPKHAAI